jgi:hypothetical protein
MRWTGNVECMGETEMLVLSFFGRLERAELQENLAYVRE